MIKTLLILFILMMPANATAWPARVVAVSDGDTITVEPEAGGERIKIRLHGIDAPERKQPHGEAARGFVIDLALFELVDVEQVGKPDRYGRVVAIIVMPDGKSLQAALLQAGLAWGYVRYCRNCTEWEALQEEARTAGRGLWANENPMPPWEWRRK